MSTARATERKRLEPGAGMVLLRRGAWVLLLVLHALALPSLIHAASATTVVGQLSLLPRIVGLALSAAFFTLKMLDVPWLRCTWDRQRIVAALLIVALLHTGVLDRALSGEDGVDPAHLPWLLASTVLVTALLVRRLMYALAVGLFTGAADRGAALIPAGLVHRTWRPHDSCAHVTFAAMRAPPIR